MKNKIITLGVLLLTLLVTSCHSDSDVIMSYANGDALSFAEAEKSYAGKYRVFWKALNTNYALWDYEKEYGLDWDAHYAKFLPQFEALDKEGDVSDDELQELMTEMAEPLHDGHLFIQFQNHATGNFIPVSPSVTRNRKRDDYISAISFKPSLKYYYNNLAEYKDYSSKVNDQLIYVLRTKGIGYNWALTKIEELQIKDNLSEAEAIEMQELLEFCQAMDKLNNMSINEKAVTYYNNLVAKYSHLNIPNLDPISITFINNGIRLTYGLFTDGIAYFYLSGFGLTPYLNKEAMAQTFSGDSHMASIVDRVKDVWESWFDAIQDLHKKGKLKGVIVDVRSNGGGMMYDSYYVLGSILPAGGFQAGYARFKRGVARYDYSPMMPFVMQTMKETHEVINDVPVVVLANGRSVSMSEITSCCANEMPNGRVIGSITHGGLCCLTDISNFSSNYNGHIGIEDKTPVYCYTPTIAFFNSEKKCLEGVGVTPDIEVAFDDKLFKDTGQDNQLDRALEYIRTGK